MLTYCGAYSFSKCYSFQLSRPCIVTPWTSLLQGYWQWQLDTGSFTQAVWFPLKSKRALEDAYHLITRALPYPHRTQRQSWLIQMSALIVISITWEVNVGMWDHYPAPWEKCVDNTAGLHGVKTGLRHRNRMNSAAFPVANIIPEWSSGRCSRKMPAHLLLCENLDRSIACVFLWKHHKSVSLISVYSYLTQQHIYCTNS